jgi:hypothetical protein
LAREEFRLKDDCKEDPDCRHQEYEEEEGDLPGPSLLATIGRPEIGSHPTKVIVQVLCLFAEATIAIVVHLFNLQE